jgi:thiol-disulfide isomerase/thioredoxin
VTSLASPLRGFGETGTAEAQSRESRELAAIGRAGEWLNSPRQNATTLLGKVVLVNFCTYSCINWLRTLPYVRAWSKKYGQQLVVIGVHTPEFEFEKNIDNVRRAVRQMGIEYPIVIDNDYSIWRAFTNQAWPALYFMDARGRIRDHHFGEGEYERSEQIIQRLLAEAGAADVAKGLVTVEASAIELGADWANVRSGENYVGYERTQNFASRGGADPDKRRNYTAPSRLALNEWALAGEWTMGRQATASSSPNGRIVYRFHARDLHLVMGPARREFPVHFRVSIDAQAPGQAHGFDIDTDGNGTVVEQRLHQLIRQPKPIVDRTFAIEFLDAGVETFSFTFG